MVEDELSKKTKKGNKVSEFFKQELERLIKQAGYNKTINSELQSFSHIGGGSEAGISDTKIKWVLNDNRIPREDFLYALAIISVQIKGANYYKMIKIDNPIKYELERYLTLCDYSIAPGSIFPAHDKFRRCTTIESEKYLSSIPNIFWDLNISYEDVINHFYNHIRYSEQSIRMDDYSALTFGGYNYKGNNNFRQVTSASMEGDYFSTPDILRFKIDNDNKRLMFKSIEAIRGLNNARILITLINGNWIELTNRIWVGYSGYSWSDLDMDNYYNSANLLTPDDFFVEITKGLESEWKSILTIEKLYEKLATNYNYREAYKQLTLTKNK